MNVAGDNCDGPGGGGPPPLPVSGQPADQSGVNGCSGLQPPPFPTDPGARKRHVLLSPFNADMPMGRYILTRGLLSLIPSLAIAFLLAATGLMTEENAPDFEGPLILLLYLIWVVSPVLETFIMAGILWLLGLGIKRKVVLAAVSALIWAVLHSLAAPMWGFAIVWPFFVFSSGYLAWKQKAWWKAIVVAIALHGFQNFIAGLLMILEAI